VIRDEASRAVSYNSLYPSSTEYTVLPGNLKERQFYSKQGPPQKFGTKQSHSDGQPEIYYFTHANPIISVSHFLFVEERPPHQLGYQIPFERS